MAIIEGPLKQVVFLHMDAPNEALPDGFVLCDGSTLNSTQQDINPGGNYTVPDLRNSFILCADSTKLFGTAAVGIGSGNINLPAGAPGPGGTGGAHNHTLSTGEMPSHTHTASTGGSVSITDPGHAHSVTDPGHIHSLTDSGHSHTASSDTAAAHNHGITDPGHTHSYQAQGGVITNGAGNNVPGASISTGSSTTGISINNAGSHSHVITVTSATTGITLASHTAGVSVNSTTTGITGSLTGLTTSNTSTGGGSAFDMRPKYYGLVAIIRVKA